MNPIKRQMRDYAAMLERRRRGQTRFEHMLKSGMFQGLYLERDRSLLTEFAEYSYNAFKMRTTPETIRRWWAFNGVELPPRGAPWGNRVTTPGVVSRTRRRELGMVDFLTFVDRWVVGHVIGGAVR
jgi:hypothetical protein